MRVCLACGQRFQSSEWRCPECDHSPASEEGRTVFAPNLAEANDGFHQDYFSYLARLEETNFWFRSRNHLLVWAIRRYFPDLASFFEIGCGTGYVLSGIRGALPSAELSGSDIFTKGLGYAGERLSGVSLYQMDARRIPFAEEFDDVGAFDVLEHVEEDDVVLRQAYLAVKPGGGMILTVPQHRFLWSAIDDYSFHKRRYERKGLLEKVEGAGFEVLRVTSFVSLLLPLVLISRLRLRGRDVEFDPLAEFKIGKIMNAFLERVLGIERILIEKGLDFPVGGSLLLIAARNRS